MYSRLHLYDSSRNVTHLRMFRDDKLFWAMSRCWSKSKFGCKKWVKEWTMKDSTKGIVFKVVLLSMGALIFLKWKHCTFSWNAILSFFTHSLWSNQSNSALSVGQCSIITQGIPTGVSIISKNWVFYNRWYLRLEFFISRVNVVFYKKRSSFL